MGAVIIDGAGRILLVRRGHAPGAGLWSVPGGRVEPGETDAAAVEREVLEETGLRVAAGALAGTVERPGPGGVTYVIRDYLASVTGGETVAGDDAAAVRWCSRRDLARLPLVAGLAEVLEEWKVWP
ncbi:MAG: hydrolase [Nonomuraea muscovyensis]|nr:hydrolase [Nonomuraea muscovyensis]